MKREVFQKRITLFSLVFSLVFLVDQVSKYLAIKFLSNGADYVFAGGFISLSYIENPYGFLGILTNAPPTTRTFLLIFVVAFLIIISIFYLLTKEYIEQPRIILAGVILAGGCSNLFDRLIHSGVIDFIAFDLYFFKTGIGNFADFMIMASGAGLGFLICRRL
ncbi:MAG: signal peptidase II [Desulfotalea sp.]